MGDGSGKLLGYGGPMARHIILRPGSHQSVIITLFPCVTSQMMSYMGRDHSVIKVLVCSRTDD